MALRATTIRFDPEVWEIAYVEAQNLGIPMSAFIRSAVLARAMVCRLRRDPELARDWARIYEASDLLIASRDTLKHDPLDPNKS